MVAGASGRHGNHAAWRVEGETEHGIAHVLIQRQDGTEKTAMGQISPQIPVICTNAKVHTLFMDMIPAYCLVYFLHSISISL